VYYKDKQVLLDVPDGRMVYDGANFVDPAKAKTVALLQTVQAQASVPFEYPIKGSPWPPSDQLTWQNTWVCKVIGVHSQATTTASDVVVTDPPADGMCVCGITCNGTEIQQVPVT
jgi:hypothetical protein